MIDHQRETGTGKIYIILLVTLVTTTLYFMNIYNPDQIIYDTLGKEYCENQTAFKYNYTDTKRNPPIIHCGIETFQIIITRINNSILPFDHYEIK